MAILRALAAALAVTSVEALAVQEGLARVAASRSVQYVSEAASGEQLLATEQVAVARQQAAQMAIMNLVLDTVEAFERLHVNGSDIKKQLTKLVEDASVVQEGYTELHAERRLPWQEREKPHVPSIAFIKTHRTGASSVTNILQRLADAKDLHVVLPEDDKDLGHLAPLEKNELGVMKDKHTYDLICHHVVYDDQKMRQYLRAEPFFFTVLREPASHTQSMFQERIDSAAGFLGYNIDVSWPERIEWLDMLWKDSYLLQEALTAEDRARFMNPQAHDLGWYRYTGGTTDFDQDERKIERWVDHVVHNMSFVLLTEHYDEGLVLLSRKLGLELRDMAYLFDHKKQNRTTPKPTAQESKMIYELNRVDAALYQRFNASFWDEWEDHGGYAALNRDLRELKLFNRVLVKACEKQNDRLCARSLQAGNVEFTQHIKAKRASGM